MLKPFTVLSLLTLFFMPLVHAEGWPNVPFLIAEGDARVDVPPEKATIQLRVVAFAKESEAAVATVQQQVTRVLEVFEKFEIPSEAITSFSIRKSVERARQDRQDLEILGYYVSRKIEAEISDLSGFGDLTAAVVGLDNVSRVDAQFDVNNRDDLEAQLTRQAGADARRKAENMAAAMAVSVGSVRAISETEFRSDGMAFYELADGVYPRMAAMRPYEDTVFAPATIAVRQSLNVVFEIDR